MAGLAETGACEGRRAGGGRWGCFTTRVRRAGASAGAHRAGVWCAVLPGSRPRSAGRRPVNAPHFWQLKGPAGTVAALFCRSHRLCIPGPEGAGGGFQPAMGLWGPRGDGQLLPAADIPKAGLGPGLYPRGDPGLLPQCSRD